jgi:hypothetical protein
MYLTFQIFRLAIDQGDLKCSNNRAHLLDLARLFALSELMNNDSSVNYEAGHFTQGTAGHLLEATKRLLVTLRPRMIPLIESWEFSDSQLMSAIGNSYGDIYE